MINALTVDIEDWYHICGVEDNMPREKWGEYNSRVVPNTQVILGILSEKNAKATFFVLGYIAKRFPQLIKEIDSLGHEIATHGFWHKLIYTEDKKTFQEDLKASIGVLQDITGKKVLGHRAASFSITNETLWALDILIKEGIKYDCSIFPILNPRYGIVDAPRFPYEIKPGLIEFSPSTLKICGANIPFAGGPYFRVLPYYLIKLAIKNINKQGKPANMYIHPWEIDSKHPKLNIPLDRSITHYANIRSTAPKLKAMLSDFSFTTAKEVLKIG